MLDKINPFEFSPLSYEPVRFYRKARFRQPDGKSVLREFATWLMPLDAFERFDSQEYAETLVSRHLGYTGEDGMLATPATEDCPYTRKPTSSQLRQTGILEYSIGKAKEANDAKKKAGKTVEDLPTYNDVELVEFWKVCPSVMEDMLSDLAAANRRANRIEEDADADPKEGEGGPLSPPSSSSTDSTLQLARS